MQLFLFALTLRGHCKVTNWPNFSIVVSRCRRLKKREGVMVQLVCGTAQNTYLSLKLIILYW